MLPGGEGAIEGVVGRRPGRLSCRRAARDPSRKVTLDAVQQDDNVAGLRGRRPGQRSRAAAGDEGAVEEDAVGRSQWRSTVVWQGSLVAIGAAREPGGDRCGERAWWGSVR